MRAIAAPYGTRTRRTRRDNGTGQRPLSRVGAEFPTAAWPGRRRIRSACRLRPPDAVDHHGFRMKRLPLDLTDQHSRPRRRLVSPPSFVNVGRGRSVVDKRAATSGTTYEFLAPESNNVQLSRPLTLIILRILPMRSAPLATCCCPANKYRRESHGQRGNREDVGCVLARTVRLSPHPSPLTHRSSSSPAPRAAAGRGP